MSSSHEEAKSSIPVRAAAGLQSYAVCAKALLRYVRIELTYWRKKKLANQIQYVLYDYIRCARISYFPKILSVQKQHFPEIQN